MIQELSINCGTDAVLRISKKRDGKLSLALVGYGAQESRVGGFAEVDIDPSDVHMICEALLRGGGPRAEHANEFVNEGLDDRTAYPLGWSSPVEFATGELCSECAVRTPQYRHYPGGTTCQMFAALAARERSQAPSP